ncbi:AlpA family phage regulatory protein [Vibrio alginolyticus]|uniref:helix-turn-helix transcriptional regulator n=1 Tax=Vibrio harveyi group TaxID=717610 RepID=UPI001EEC0194|nr:MULTISPECIES: AlpA family phage regulatory protein [Vibrio harveyi group]ELA7189541.1 AlpA family phage regulatory protein [Vibrio alginolyticus]MCG6318689.1 AlpA family phage regulatory protein [Vibrio alginolyticus]
MITKRQIKEKLSISEGTISNLPGFPNKIESNFLVNQALYRTEEVYSWLIKAINQRNGCKQYSNDITKERIIRISELTNYLNISRSYAYDQIQKGSLPPLVKIGERASGFLLSEINAKLKECGIAPIE